MHFILKCLEWSMEESKHGSVSAGTIGLRVLKKIFHGVIIILHIPLMTVLNI